jgi:hypothetical protein
MKITVTKIKRELEKNYGWDTEYLQGIYISDLIKDVRTVIDNELLKHKNLTIKE